MGYWGYSGRIMAYLKYGIVERIARCVSQCTTHSIFGWMKAHHEPEKYDMKDQCFVGHNRKPKQSTPMKSQYHRKIHQTRDQVRNKRRYRMQGKRQ